MFNKPYTPERTPCPSASPWSPYKLPSQCTDAAGAGKIPTHSPGTMLPPSPGAQCEARGGPGGPGLQAERPGLGSPSPDALSLAHLRFKNTARDSFASRRSQIVSGPYRQHAEQ